MMNHDYKTPLDIIDMGMADRFACIISTYTLTLIAILNYFAG